VKTTQYVLDTAMHNKKQWILNYKSTDHIGG